MWSSVIPTVIVVGLIFWVMAVLDLIRATDMEPTGRLILAAVVIFAAPIGVLLWMGIRGGRLGALAAVSIGTVAIGLAISVAAASTFSPRTTVQVEVAGPHVSVTAPQPPSR
jgi:hypothetical protein